jgi:hypothetical protein
MGCAVLRRLPGAPATGLLPQLPQGPVSGPLQLAVAPCAVRCRKPARRRRRRVRKDPALHRRFSQVLGRLPRQARRAHHRRVLRIAPTNFDSTWGSSRPLRLLECGWMICCSSDMQILAFGTGLALGQRGASVRRHGQLIFRRHDRGQISADIRLRLHVPAETFAASRGTRRQDGQAQLAAIASAVAAASVTAQASDHPRNLRVGVVAKETGRLMRSLQSNIGGSRAPREARILPTSVESKAAIDGDELACNVVCV